MSSPRIIGGKARGQRLQDVPGDITRPITDRVKEALFNILGNDVVDSVFLDLFGGTGSVGIEALSRGASSVVLIDNHRAAVATIKANLQKTRLESQASVLHTDAFGYLRHSPNQHFDYIYVAPPQYKDLWQQTLQLLDEQPEWLSPDGWIIVQIHPVEYEKQRLQHFEEFDQRHYGSTLLVFYQFRAGEE